MRTATLAALSLTLFLQSASAAPNWKAEAERYQREALSALGGKTPIKTFTTLLPRGPAKGEDMWAPAREWWDSAESDEALRQTRPGAIMFALESASSTYKTGPFTVKIYASGGAACLTFARAQTRGDAEGKLGGEYRKGDEDALTRFMLTHEAEHCAETRRSSLEPELPPGLDRMERAKCEARASEARADAWAGWTAAKKGGAHMEFAERVAAGRDALAHKDPRHGTGVAVREGMRMAAEGYGAEETVSRAQLKALPDVCLR